MSKQFQCTNFGNCKDADNGTVFEESKVEEIDGSFSCPTCHQKLEEIHQKKAFNGKAIGIIAGALALIAAIVVGIIMLLNHKSASDEPVQKATPDIEQPVAPVEKPTVVHDTVVVEKKDTLVRRDTVVVEKTKTVSQPARPKVTQFSYGSFKGNLKNGQPHDVNGTMTYTSRHLIDSRDPQKRYAEPGDYVIGEFSDGKLVQGVWYDRTNTVKGSIIIGK
ncbi:hypothetical protein [Candidatus Ruminimicrobium bovinum]|uniref:hypothetical protein n=1 Tax=Candidatus Ruminimicrobium bovinum TaxID=3242779 RepID=UPI0039B853F3